MRKSFSVLAEKYQAINETPLEVEVTSSGEHRTTHNVQMARTKALQAAEVAAQLHALLQTMPEDEPLHAWKVTHITQSADMLQDVLASLKEDMLSGREIENLVSDEEGEE
jgi:hypothetical protein